MTVAVTPTTLVIFAKAPLAGQVKTRLQPEFDRDQSLAIHRTLVRHTVAVARQLDDMVIELWVSGAHEFWQQLDGVGSGKGDIRVYTQHGNSLGERMHNACQQVLRRSERVLLIGSDCPAMTAAYLRRAVAQLQRVPVVLGPAEDGGYVMIAMTTAVIERVWPLFESIHWGSTKVLAQTRAALDDQQLDHAEMEMLWDIDRPEDIARTLDLPNPLGRAMTVAINPYSENFDPQ